MPESKDLQACSSRSTCSRSSRSRSPFGLATRDFFAMTSNAYGLPERSTGRVSVMTDTEGRGRILCRINSLPGSTEFCRRGSCPRYPERIPAYALHESELGVTGWKPPHFGTRSGPGSDSGVTACAPSRRGGGGGSGVRHRNGRLQPRDMGMTQIAGFLTRLATDANVSAGTQNQALSALLFL
ncbi:phage integrase N-terminal SAM-like domain-containing protein [Luteimonas sp. RC10]|uniref:phage integrase N-terminal SAM-like domain-containing protein n=1 Tax=Luteimonas sp. RC10 TaxID=2587035 RepID=UPI0031F2E7F1